MEIVVAQTREQIHFCKDIIFAFRTELEEATYQDLIMHMITNESYKLAYLPNHDNTKAAAFIGYRSMHMLLHGNMIYVDDLYTDPAYRGGGFAGKLLNYVVGMAAHAGIKTIHLDSGYDLHDAHRLYLNNGYVLACNHFARKV
ncbi:GNAT family N-acetyltransferase [Dyadobacter sp. CY351]|uniref:GNAT family N-acetyltransferase n=1 Tax=Dyadobacter sp. CY351 TaxID=2909337 RepID=UPI001F40026F|nr:GNAT family N-acetyltransferase [Dyadobacter sp. CY351]MCF2518359.1 GNAT family N-acetyltransferase [Dyadobacter sp. CY351]